MCGIFYYHHHGYVKHLSIGKLKTLQDLFYKTSHRGPDNSIFLNRHNRCYGFHRLSINGLGNIGNQPFECKGCLLICNGEIYNFKQLIEKYSIDDYSENGSDCEIIIHLYKRVGIKAMLNELDGVFAMVLVDYERDETYVARDPFGVRSLYVGTTDNDIGVGGKKGEFFTASEMKSIPSNVTRSQVPSGSYGHYVGNGSMEYERYYNACNKFYEYNIDTAMTDEAQICNTIKTLLEKSVIKRLMSERPIGALLSGGIDSTLVTALLCKHMGDTSKLNTFSIGLEGSVDLYWGRVAAKYFGTNHHEVCLTETEFLSAIEYTIYQIESYDTTTVRASLPNYLISKYIYNNTDSVVIFCGDMSDEVFGSYRGFTKATSESAFKMENERMVRDVRYFDLLRSDKSISGAGLEARVPFADKEFLNFVMSIPPRFKMFTDERIEKHILRQAFSDATDSNGRPLLPSELLWRRKEAFSDGVSGGNNDRTWVQMMKEYADARISDAEWNEYERAGRSSALNAPYDKESYYYRKIYDKYYKDCIPIPYWWKHPFCTEKDPSARLLKCYK